MHGGNHKTSGFTERDNIYPQASPSGQKAIGECVTNWVFSQAENACLDSIAGQHHLICSQTIYAIRYISFHLSLP